MAFKFGSIHPKIPNPMIMVLDLVGQITMVELQDQIEGRISKLISTDWIVPDPGPFFQIRFLVELKVELFLLERILFQMLFKFHLEVEGKKFL